MMMKYLVVKQNIMVPGTPEHQHFDTHFPAMAEALGQAPIRTARNEALVLDKCEEVAKYKGTSNKKSRWYADHDTIVDSIQSIFI